MDALANLFPIFSSTELLQTVISIIVAAVVFFYSVYLLRKEEVAEQAENENAALDMSGEVQRHA